MRRLATGVIVLATAVCAAAVIAIYSGALTFLASDSNVSKNALWAIVTYWGAFVLLVLLVAGVVSRPREMLMSLVVTLLFLVGLEVALRVIDVDRAKIPYSGLSSSRFHHVNAPGAEMSMGQYDGHTVIIKDNEDGLRCNLSREEFLKHDDRILVMGDSFVWGMGVRQEKIVTEVMQRRLRERHGDDVAVLAGAAISYSPLLHRQLYKSVFSKYRPTVVVLVLDASDIGDDVKYDRENVGTDDTLRFDLPDQHPARWHLAVHRLAEPLLAALGDNFAYPYDTFFKPGRSSYDYYDFELHVGDAVEKNRFFIYRHPLSETRPYFERTLSIIDDIAREVRDDGAHFVLAVAPRYHHWSERECPGNWEVRQYKYTGKEPYASEYIHFFEDAAPTRDYEVLDLLHAFQATDRYPLVFATDPHWNDAGHEFVAGLLCDFLEKRGWVR